MPVAAGRSHGADWRQPGDEFVLLSQAIQKVILLSTAVGWIPVQTALSGQLIHDIVPDELAELALPADANVSRPERLQSFLAHSHPEIYQRSTLFQLDPDFLKRYVSQIDVYLPAIHELDTELPKNLESVLPDFQRLFPDFQPSKTKIDLILSLFRFDAKVPHDDTGTLLIGLDALAKFYGRQAPLRVILSHELFHLYHFQVNPLPRDLDQLTLGRQVWQEGLATYVSHEMNPSAPMRDILLDPRLAAEGPAFIPQAAREIEAKLQSTDDADTAIYLLHNNSRLRPSRMGYLVGYEIARRLAQSMTLTELAHLRGRALVAAMRTELNSMSSSPGQEPRGTETGEETK